MAKKANTEPTVEAQAPVIREVIREVAAPVKALPSTAFLRNECLLTKRS